MMTTIEKLIDGFSHAGAYQPGADPRLYGIEVTREVPYRATANAAHRLDVYRPAYADGPLPVVMYVHGGGFKLMSKRTQWMMAIAFARRGFVVFNIDYRMAPEHPFPAAIEDVSDAYLWVLRNAHRYGGDALNIVVGGESAGANLVTSLTVEATFRREERWARRVFDAGVVPAAVVGLAGIYQVSGIDRLVRGSKLPSVAQDWVRSIERDYLGDLIDDAAAVELANPLLVLEGDTTPQRELPPFFLSVGGRDPLVDDSARLADALRRRGVDLEATVYGSEMHAFQMLTWRRAAKTSWADTFRFLGTRAPQLGLAADGRRARKTSRFERVRDRVRDVMAA